MYHKHLIICYQISMIFKEYQPINLQASLQYLIQDYLYRKGFFKAYLQFDAQSNFKLDLPEELQFLRKLIFLGDFQHLWPLLQMFSEHMDKQKSRRMYLAVLKQQLFQQVQNPDEQTILNLFRGKNGFFNICSSEEAEQYFYYLSLNSMKDDCQFGEWNKEKGRLDCYLIIKQLLQQSRLVPQIKPKGFISLQDVFCRFIQLVSERVMMEEQRKQRDIIKQQSFINQNSPYVSAQQKVKLSMSCLQSESQSKEYSIHKDKGFRDFFNPFYQIELDEIIKKVQLSKSGKLIACGLQQSLRLFEIDQNNSDVPLLMKGSWKIKSQQKLRDIRWKEDKCLLFCTNLKLQILSNKRQDSDQFFPVQLVKYKESYFRSAVWHKDDITFVTEQSLLGQWDLVKGKQVVQGFYNKHSSYFSSLRNISHLISNNKHVFTVNSNHIISSYDFRSKSQSFVYRLDKMLVSIESLNESTLLCATDDSIYLFDLATQRVRATVQMKQKISKMSCSLRTMICFDGIERAVLMSVQQCGLEIRAETIGLQGGSMSNENILALYYKNKMNIHVNSV